MYHGWIPSSCILGSNWGSVLKWNGSGSDSDEMVSENIESEEMETGNTWGTIWYGWTDGGSDSDRVG